MLKALRMLSFTVLLTALVIMPGARDLAFAQVLLRDAESEEFLKDVSTPIFLAANLDPEAVDMYLIYDPSINAFVARGQNIFLFSGLILASDDLNQLLGVIAHETGHLAGGHIARFGEASKVPMAIMLTSILLGIAAAAAGSSDAAIGLIMGGQSMAQRAFLSYTRVQESSADQAGLTFLEKSGISAKGMMSFFDKLRDYELLATPLTKRDPYSRTHPLSTDRILRLRDRAENSENYFKPTPDADIERFERVRAKLYGYVHEPQVTLRKYPLSDQSIAARYARVYAYHKSMDWDKAMAEVNSLISEDPFDPYFYEIAGQILFESGRVVEAVPYFEKSTQLRPFQPLFLTALGHALVAQENPETDKKAILILEKAVFLDPNDDLAWRQLAVVYSRSGNDKMANIATAELFLLQGRYRAAIQFAGRAFERFPEGSREWLRAQDIMITAKSLAKNDPRFK